MREAIADRIHRLGDDLVNFCLVEDDTGLTLVDAGLPSHHDATVRAIAALDKPLRAILPTGRSQWTVPEPCTPWKP